MQIRFLLPLFLFLVACAGENNPEQRDSSARISSAKKEIVYQKPPNQVEETHLNPLPSPLKIAVWFRTSGLVFREDALFSADNVMNFNSLFSKQLAIGMYSADFTYCALNAESQSSNQYLKVMEELASDVGFASVYNTEENRDRFMRNANNLDSISYLIAEIQENADLHFQNNNESDKAFIIFAGAWVESMYIGSRSKDLSTEPSIAECLFGQKEILDDLIACLESIETDQKSNAQQLLAKMQPVKQHLDAVNPEGLPISQVILKSKQVREFVNSINELRDYITNHP